MTISLAADTLVYAEAGSCIIALAFMARKSQLKDYKFLAAFLLTRLLVIMVGIPLIRPTSFGLDRHLAYRMYFWVYWSSYAIEACLSLAIIYSIYRLAMAPLKGLQTLGILMFRWAAGIATAVALAMAFGPHVTGLHFIMRAVSQLQQTQSVLTLCMLLFVCLAIRPMGLSYRSKIFGVSLGLGILATMDLVGSAWLAHSVRLESVYNIINGLAICSAISVWSFYFALPEPRRRMIVLPTTSPFLRWNQISIALGDDPGYVAIGDIHPDMFAPAEVEIMRRASLKMANMSA